MRKRKKPTTEWRMIWADISGSYCYSCWREGDGVSRAATWKINRRVDWSIGMDGWMIANLRRNDSFFFLHLSLYHYLLLLLPSYYTSILWSITSHDNLLAPSGSLLPSVHCSLFATLCSLSGFNQSRCINFSAFDSHCGRRLRVSDFWRRGPVH